jgi:hypothetical protein
MGWTSPEAREAFQWLVRFEQERRRRDRETVTEELQTVPASEKTLERLGALSPEDAGTVLRKHPGYALHRKIESVRTMLELYRRALSDLTTAIEELPELGRPDERAVREQREHEVSVRVNKELFAALGAAKTLVDYSRRIKDLVDAKTFDSKRGEAFDPGEHAMITDLRNVVLHQVHSRANWQKRWRAGAKSTHFIIKREDLLADGELNAAARKYLDQLGPTCDVTELLRGYSERMEQFYAWLLSEVEEHLPIEVKGYRVCRKAVKQQHGKLSYETIVGLWTQAGADPYEHLTKHLTTEQMKEADALPHRSPQQVDYIIACLVKDGICDDHLRTVIYKFFKVDSPERPPTSLTPSLKSEPPVSSPDVHSNLALDTGQLEQ